MVDDDSGGPLVERITGIRKQVSKALGFIIPGGQNKRRPNSCLQPIQDQNRADYCR